ncbi:MAG: hypothetical protein ACREFQ_02635 [Stellaceae bacterium]
MRLILLAGAALLTLAGCDQMGPGYSRSGAYAPSPGIYAPARSDYGADQGYRGQYVAPRGPEYAPNYAPRTEGSGASILRNDSAATPRERAEQGCASGQTADMLHQNRPGGSDYSRARCGAAGY